MKHQIDKLVELIPQVKEAAMAIYAPSCSHKEVIDDKFVIYFADGYKTFQYRVFNHIEVAEFCNTITFKYSTTEADLNQAIATTLQAIEIMENKTKAEKQAELLAQKERLENELKEIEKYL